MAKKQLNDKLYGLLDSRGYKPDMYDSSGKKVAVPEEAELLQFSFIKDGEDYGRATVTIDGSHRLIVYYNDKSRITRFSIMGTINETSTQVRHQLSVGL
jgi:hypothetical protein